METPGENSGGVIDIRPPDPAPTGIASIPGDTIFFGPYTAHASVENTSDKYRRVLINGYASPGANRRVYPGDGAGRRLNAPAGFSRNIR